MKKIISLAVLFAGLAMSAPAEAGPPAWSLDSAHCGFYFDIRHIFSTVRGQFDTFSGSLAFDPNDLEGSAVDIRVDVKSVDTNIRRRDDHLRGEDFFDAAGFPEMRFQSRRIRDLGQNRYEVVGMLSVKDVTREITVPFELLGVKEHPARKGVLVAGFEGRFTIDRLAYHVGGGRFYKMGLVGKDVDVTLSLEMVRDED